LPKKPDVADEVMIVDSGSKDKTVEIASLAF
jgi:glycosyltransferase involved in cell wall biosynthesis